ncbi:MAG: hypothetical protein U0R69_03605 [Gaiellales bacterium]
MERGERFIDRSSARTHVAVGEPAGDEPDTAGLRARLGGAELVSSAAASVSPLDALVT